MDSEIIAVSARHLERIMIVLAGALSIVLGYRTFLSIPRRTEKGEGKLELPGGISIYVTRVGPGVFFALFGAVILALGLYKGLTVDVREGVVPASATTGATRMEERHLSSAVPSGASTQQQEVERTGALGTVAQLARLVLTLDGPGGRSLSQQQRLDFGLALTDARLRLLAAVWSEREWGAYPEFTRWVQNGETGPPPTRAAPAVRAYRGDR